MSDQQLRQLEHNLNNDTWPLLITQCVRQANGCQPREIESEYFIKWCKSFLADENDPRWWIVPCAHHFSLAYIRCIKILPEYKSSLNTSYFKWFTSSVR